MDWGFILEAFTGGLAGAVFFLGALLPFAVLYAAIHLIGEFFEKRGRK